MKGMLSIVLLLGMLLVGYLIVKDLDVLSGGQDGQVTISPMEQARGAAELVNRTRDGIRESIDKLDR